MRRKTITNVDVAKLKDYIKNTMKTTCAEISYQIGKSETYISAIGRQQEGVPEPVYRLICEKCSVPYDFFLIEEKSELPKADNAGTILENLFGACESIRKAVQEGMKDTVSQISATDKVLTRIEGELSRIAEQQEVILRKVSANTLQLERIKESTVKISETDAEKAERFLKDSLADGDRLGTDILNEADARGIKRAELMKAKSRLGIINYTTGYGKRQKAWWGGGESAERKENAGINTEENI